MSSVWAITYGGEFDSWEMNPVETVFATEALAQQRADSLNKKWRRNEQKYFDMVYGSELRDYNRQYKQSGNHIYARPVRSVVNPDYTIFVVEEWKLITE